MGQPQQGFQRLHQGVAGASQLGFGAVAVVDHDFGQFQIPVAVLAPGEFVDRLGGVVEAVAVHGVGGLLDGVLQTVEYPAVRQAQGNVFAVVATVFVGGVHEHVTGGVPQFVAEIAVAFDAPQVEFDVAAGGGQGGEGETQCVGAEGGDAVGEFPAGGVFDFGGHVGLHQAAGAFSDQRFQFDAVDQVDGVQHIALGFGHFLAVGIAHQAVNVDFVKRHVAGEFEPHHDHAGDPEENDVKTGDQHVGGVEGVEVFGVFGPAQGGEGPQRRGEPGVEHVGVLGEYHVLAVFFPGLGAGGLLVAGDEDVAVFVIPRRDAVAPPDLA